MIGRTLSHYRVLEEISRGGMGIVFRALDLNLDRDIALKILPRELVADPERKRRFIQEAKAAARLEHPHIGTVYEIDEADGVTFIAMELIRGETLRETDPGKVWARFLTCLPSRRGGKRWITEAMFSASGLSCMNCSPAGRPFRVRAASTR